MRMLAALLSFAVTAAAVAADPAAADAKSAAALPGASGPAAAPAPSLSAPPAYGKSSGLFPGMVVGPKLALLPFPGAFGLGVEAKFQNLIGVGLDYNFIPTVNFGDVKAGYNDFALSGRVFPWKGRFHLGLALGQRNFFAKASDSATGQDIKIEVKSTYLAPEIGWRFVWASGFFMGVDLGYQFILSPKTTLTLPAAANLVDQTDKKAVEDAGDEIGKFGLPIISLLQFGFFL